MSQQSRSSNSPPGPPSSGDQVSPWWEPSRHADRRPRLISRGEIAAAIRRHFADAGFIEVETSALQRSPGNETHLHAFATREVTPAGDAGPLYLRTSPEFACKKLLAAGERRIFDFARVFRNRERSALHHPEFTLLEWYRAGEPYEALMDDCAALLRLTAATVGTSELRWRGATCDGTAEPERLTLAEAFARHAGIDLLATLGPDGTGDRDRLAAAAASSGIAAQADDGWSDLFSKVLVERIEPQLGIGRPTVLCEYPIGEAALARAKPTDPRVAERFELYAAGIELANAFAELTDPTEQRRRFEADMDEMQRIYGTRYPLDESFLAALAQMPAASGIALGFDRLVMLATGAGHIADVLWDPVPEPGAGSS